MWEALAVLVLSLHGGLILFNLAAPALAWRRPAWRVAHVVSIVLTIIIISTTTICPLTDLEKSLWVRAGKEPYPGGFTSHWMETTLHVPLSDVWLGRATRAWFVLWGLVYVWLWRRAKSAASVLSRAASRDTPPGRPAVSPPASPAPRT